jgi:amino acid transporter
MTVGLGSMGGRVISMLVCISCLGAINGMLFTGSRLYYALGREQPAFAWLGHWNQRLGTPVRALLLQAVVALALLWVFGLYHNAFELLVIFTVPLFWTFLLLVSVAVIYLRLTDHHTPRPFRLPLFPLEPAIFFCASLLMIYKGIEYLGFQKRDFAFYFSAGSMVTVMLAGSIVYALTRVGAKRAKV